MALTWEDRAAITELISMHGHLCDSGELDRLDEVPHRRRSLRRNGLRAGAAGGTGGCHPGRARAGGANPVGHHVTNIVLTEVGDRQVHARSKGIGIYADGTCASLTYEDIIVRRDRGWRISDRKLLARRAPFAGK